VTNFSRITSRLIAIAALMIVALIAQASAQLPAAKLQIRRQSLRPKPARRKRRLDQRLRKLPTLKFDRQRATGVNRRQVVDERNDFGDSEVIFTQNGSSVSGVIHYADGRSGTINGTMVGNGFSTPGQIQAAMAGVAG